MSQQPVELQNLNTLKFGLAFGALLNADNKLDLDLDLDGLKGCFHISATR